MDGVAASSFIGLPPLPLSSHSRATPQSRLNAVITPPSQQFSTQFAISRSGSALAHRTEVQREQLAQLDPQLVEHYRAVLDLLNQTNPEAVDDFLDFMDNVLAHANASDTPSPVAETSFPTALGVELNVSVRVSEFVAQVQSGQVTVSQESLELNVQVRGEKAVQKKVDPLVLDMDGDGVETSGVDGGIIFDIEANGNAAPVSFVQGEDVLLALDRNGNGVIDNGGELFGTQHGAKNGFEELKKFDDNHDGVINEQDVVFSQLRGLRRRVDNLELVSLSQLGVQELFTTYQERRETLVTGDEILQNGAFRYRDGALGRAFDVGLSLRA